MKFLCPSLILTIVLLLPIQPAIGQSWDKDYFFHAFDRKENIPDPAEFMGFAPGEWHPNHLQVELYLEALADASPRAKRVLISRSHENRPMSVLVITSPENHERLEALRQCHLARIDRDNFQCEDDALDPLVLYQAYTSHGNEPSGTGAALLYAWYLTSSREPGIRSMLEETVIILDACMNPDGYDRFVSWVNRNRGTGAQLVSDPNDDEFHEPWPRSRTNHYWFDLNRDWLPVQHPESIGKIRMFQSWKPHVLADHHEMGSNATYFFQPGIPSRTNPMTPAINQELTAAIANYHAEALDRDGVPYYSKERFDDYYYGKGSTYPDIQGCVGILFEQASSRGHIQQTIHGELSFAETIRNQLNTSLSTLRGSYALRDELKSYQREFFSEALNEGRRHGGAGYLIEGGTDLYRSGHFVQMMLTHEIEVYAHQDHETLRYFVPFDQIRHQLVRTIFETVHEFPDSLFYDVSTWTMPMAFGLESTVEMIRPGELQQWEKLNFHTFDIPGTYRPFKASNTAYLIRWNDFRSPGLLHRLLDEGLKAKVAFEPFSVSTTDGVTEFERGSILILPGIQEMSAEKTHEIIDRESKAVGIRVYSGMGGMSHSGPDLGSPTFRMVELPKILMVTGAGINGNKAGEIWFYFDRHLNIPITRVSTERLDRIDLSAYNVIILPSTWGMSSEEDIRDKLRQFVASGNTLILEGSASRWAVSGKLSNVDITNLVSRPEKVTNYSNINNAYGALAVGGCILRAEGDLSNPLLFGYESENFYIFKRKRWVLSAPENHLAAPLRYSADPLASGYLHERHQRAIPNQASILVENSGRGKIIHLSDGTFFRGYWFGNAHILSNAVFFGGMIDRRAGL
ncbi:MAG: zinc carboxypeptidase [Saprospirales bacterium]|nr:MAG: zinc carboxypeptidase [Saprospirales bacterium]